MAQDEASRLTRQNCTYTAIFDLSKGPAEMRFAPNASEMCIVTPRYTWESMPEGDEESTAYHDRTRPSLVSSL